MVYFWVYLPRDEAISIQVVHGEGPLELLLQLSPGGDRQGAEEFSEIARAVVVGVERAKDVLGELGRVAVGEEVSVDLLELLDAELAVGAVLEEALVPLLDLCVGELCVGPEVVQDFRFQLAVLLTHGGCSFVKKITVSLSLFRQQGRTFLKNLCLSEIRGTVGVTIFSLLHP